MAEIFASYSGIVVFLHVLAALIWVGGMIAIKLSVAPAIGSIDDELLKLSKINEITTRFFKLVFPFIIISVLTAVIMLIGIGFKGTDLNSITHIKEAIWIIMLINFIAMFVRNNKVTKLLQENETDKAKKATALISNIMLPINILLGLVAVYLGVTLRGF